MTIDQSALRRLIREIFAAAGSNNHEAERIAFYLVEANLVGHDAQGVIQVPRYIERVHEGQLVPNQKVEIVTESEVLTVLDGRLGFGQVIGEEAMEIALGKSTRFGLSLVALRNSGPLGRIGGWAEMAARAGLVSLHFVNQSGGSALVAPHGGDERRLLGNPIAAGVPVPGGPPIILDMSPCAFSEGTIRVAAREGTNVPEGTSLDGQSQPGAALPLGGHAGFALGVLVEVLAGTLSGGSRGRPGTEVVSHNMLTLVIDPARLRARPEFDRDLADFTAWVKSASLVEPDGEILMPGEVEHRSRAKRLREGIPLHPATWKALGDVARGLRVRIH